MTQEEFIDLIEELASAYAMDVVADPMYHMDAVGCVKEDYIEGAYAAYRLLTKEEI